MIENEYGISRIKIESTAKNYCPLGKDWYTNNFTIEIDVADSIPDYCDIDEYIYMTINGRSMIIEEAVKYLHDFIVNKYNPDKCVVRSYVDDAAHSAVTVEKVSV